jgi:CheY-like chemotaxis protein/MinD-like ATPase involved in chromosome partitioning or flagellar assembly
MSERILIVDDDLDSLKLIGLMLQRHGYEVMAANAGNQALTKAASDHPDLIILDVMMPDMDGYEVCRRLRGNQNTRGIPIIMFTAKTLVDDKVAGFEAGADDYLTKPTHPAELASRVKAILARNAGKRRPAPTRGMTIGVIGAKGGVGTTTLALNAAAALVMAGENPVVADFRLGSGSMSLMLGVDNATGMANVLSKAATEIQPTLIEKEIVTHSSTLRALLSSTKPQETQIKYSVETAVAVVNNLRTLGRPAIFDLGSGYSTTLGRLQLEMDQVILVVDPYHITLAMARELIQELESANTSTNRIHVVVVNRSPFNVPWNEVENFIGRELRAIISDAPELVYQATRATVPMVILQPNAIVSNQIVKLTEDLNTRIRTMAGSQLMT